MGHVPQRPVHRTRDQGNGNGYGADYFRIELDFTVKIDSIARLRGVLLEPTSIVAKAWDQTERIGRRSRAWQPRSLLVTGADQSDCSPP